ncbi:MAG: hypothetical protein COU32_03225 [Candidatus Magasanikbacteria bacterium CG10_big_fil_rev_8_21_14_0_10_42_10]|uniref:Type 4a pilus biogenesis protein PilO n=2 Tax=Candidatus Magasanikiibacteriota TaxID=1752731 RepID=A0A2H0TXM6_9BACT|nr:MAG: hypothetical protein COU32_03225 [Candidatus Magasanikbacteria bacterium CG10_big_fil_rev_8_21_14_0_10_42_10]PIZ93190.1 MAG: hypothetical protein COX82_03040 [Candidatus Magasanikbacteria bacterium CG_4_10_14_0_2_um_filter_41_10]
MLHRLSLKKQFYIISSTLFLGSLLLGVFIIYPTLKRMFMVSDDIKGIQQELEQEYNSTQAMRRTLRELDSISQEVESYKDIAMPYGDELTIIEKLEALATNHNLRQTLGATRSNIPDPTVGLPYYTFSFVLNGSFEDLFSYIQTLEAQSYYVLIDGIKIQKATDAGQATLRFDARIYTRSTPE